VPDAVSTANDDDDDRNNSFSKSDKKEIGVCLRDIEPQWLNEIYAPKATVANTVQPAEEVENGPTVDAIYGDASSEEDDEASDNVASATLNDNNTDSSSSDSDYQSDAESEVITDNELWNKPCGAKERVLKENLIPYIPSRIFQAAMSQVPARTQDLSFADSSDEEADDKDVSFSLGSESELTELSSSDDYDSDSDSDSDYQEHAGTKRKRPQAAQKSRLQGNKRQNRRATNASKSKDNAPAAKRAIVAQEPAIQKGDGDDSEASTSTTTTTKGKGPARKTTAATTTAVPVSYSVWAPPVRKAAVKASAKIAKIEGRDCKGI